MIASSKAPSMSSEDLIAQLQELMNKLERAIQELKSYLESLPGDSDIERLLIHLGERHASRTNQLLSSVPCSANGLSSAVNFVQTYLQVTELLYQNFCDDIRRKMGEPETAVVQTYMNARQALDKELVNVLRVLEAMSSAPPVTTPGISNPKIDELFQKSKEILDVLDAPGIPTDAKVTKFIEYLEKDAEPILKSDGTALTEPQIGRLIEIWSSATEKLPSIVPATEEERKRGVTQQLKIRELSENNYDRLAEILRIKDPLGFRTP